MNTLSTRRGARRISEVPQAVLACLATGEIETVNLMEWLATDMAALARSVSAATQSKPLKEALAQAANLMASRGITARLAIAGQAIVRAIPDLDGSHFHALARHRSDVVRQWACYAVNASDVPRSLIDRLALTLPFAADGNMSVREVAWMAFRPHILANVEAAIELLEPITRDPNSSIRRFAVEVTRPRSVWGTHCGQLKRRPQEALSLLENVRQDRAHYVQLAVGNWLNDASKSRPDWVVEVCNRWSAEGDHYTKAIVRRGLRTVTRRWAAIPEGRMLGLGPPFAGL
jgi:3-methyladenine DNA glycosylase AlkC